MTKYNQKLIRNIDNLSYVYIILKNKEKNVWELYS